MRFTRFNNTLSAETLELRLDFTVEKTTPVKSGGIYLQRIYYHLMLPLSAQHSDIKVSLLPHLNAGNLLT